MHHTLGNNDEDRAGVRFCDASRRDNSHTFLLMVIETRNIDGAVGSFNFADVSAKDSTVGTAINQSEVIIAS